MKVELAWVTERLLKTLSHRLFMEAQRYSLKHRVASQDNKSAIVMETSEKRSCTKRARNLNVHYFYIKELIDRKEVDLNWCPTENMLADFFSKPLQVNLFRNLRSVVLGNKLIPALHSHKHMRESKECARIKKCAGNY